MTGVTVRSMASAYPDWAFYPRSSEPPAWASDVVQAFHKVQPAIDSAAIQGLKSDGVLSAVAPALVDLGFEVETGKSKHERIRRPVLYGDRGSERVSYEIDGWHDSDGIVLEVEAGRAWMGNAIYRDLIRTSLIVGARFLVLAVMSQYRYKSSGREQRNDSFSLARDQLDAIYASGRLSLPFDGILLIGY